MSDVPWWFETNLVTSQSSCHNTYIQTLNRLSQDREHALVYPQ